MSMGVGPAGVTINGGGPAGVIINGVGPAGVSMQVLYSVHRDKSKSWVDDVSVQPGGLGLCTTSSTQLTPPSSPPLVPVGIPVIVSLHSYLSTYCM